MSGTHGHSRGCTKSPVYSRWTDVCKRSRVCVKWRKSFLAFLADVGARPSERHELRQIDPRKGYRPGNVYWRRQLHCICPRSARSLCGWAKAKTRPRQPECVTRRFWRSVRKTRTCWYWTGSKDRKGYGRIRLPISRKRIFVHRLAWAILRERLPTEKELVCHKCNTPLCVRPSKRNHMYLGDYFTNNRDTVSSGHHRGFVRRRA